MTSVFALLTRRLVGQSVPLFCDNSCLSYAKPPALERIVSTRPLPSQKYEIFSDSKSALAASTPSTSTKSSQPFSSIVKILAALCTNIKFFWIPSHSGHSGNEMADSISKSAAQSWSSHHPSLPMTKSYEKYVILNYINTI
jgi:hypothetical protein